ncbi:MAG TPA: glycoside hydrolase family 3 N-terminal domain-containing protein [Pseudonocardia sp.]
MPGPVVLPLLLLCALLLSACSAPRSGSPSAGPGGAPGSATPSPSAAPPPPSCVDTLLTTLPLRQLAGQLLIVGSPLGAAVQPSLDLIKKLPVGGVLLTGRSRQGVAAVAARTAALQKANSAGAGLLIAADQEGGQVQTLTGPGFSAIPTAVEQGRWSSQRLITAAAKWGAELKAAGVRLDLAPVSDVLSAQLGSADLAVGVSHRTFGTEPGSVGASVLAFTAGLAQSDVAGAVKHFPGLGRVGPNTDLTANVHDTTTSVDSPWLDPFRRAVDAGVPVVMVSSAIYTQIDPTQLAAFSRPVITDLLRTRMGFNGVVISDDLGKAVAVAAVPVADRAVRFVAAGGDIVLTASPDTAPAMLEGLVAKATADPDFAATVRAAARRVLTAKQALHLLPC